MLKARDEWRTAEDAHGLATVFSEALRREVPGILYSFTQPIELRFAELIAGVRSDVGVKIYGDDLAELKRLGDRVSAALAGVRGASDVKAEQVAGLPVARIRIDRQAIARYGINARQVLDVIETIGGRDVGTVLEEQRRYALDVRFKPEARDDVDALSRWLVASPRGSSFRCPSSRRSGSRRGRHR